MIERLGQLTMKTIPILQDLNLIRPIGRLTIDEDNLSVIHDLLIQGLGVEVQAVFADGKVVAVSFASIPQHKEQTNENL